MSHDFKLGPSILKAEDSPHLPDLWLSSLLHKHLDGPARAAFAQSNKAALNLLLSEWPQAALTLRVQAFATDPPERLVRRMHAAQQQIAARGSKQTLLAVKQHGAIPEGEAWWHIVCAKLTATRAGLYFRNMPSALFHFLGQAWPALSELALSSPNGQNCAVELPAPGALPALRSLSLLGTPVPGDQGALWERVGSYMPQLTSLVIGQHFAAANRVAEYFFMDTLFTPAHTSQTITKLELPYRLTQQLARLLQQHIPALQELTVAGVSAAHVRPMGEVAVEHNVCSWNTLRLTQRGDVSLHAWAWLPLPAAGTLAVVCCTPTSTNPGVHVQLPLQETVTRKLENVAFTGGHEYRVIATVMQPHEQPAALRAALPTLTSNTTIGTSPELEGFTMSSELAAVLATAAGPGGVWSKPALLALTWPDDAAVATPLPPLRTVELAEPLTDGILEQLVQCVQQAGRLSVPSTSLQAPLAEGAAWPFEHIHVNSSVTLVSWVPQAELLGQRVVWELDHLDVRLSKLMITSGEAARIAEQLSRVRIHSISSTGVNPDMDAPETDGPSLLRESLTLLRAVPCKHGRLCINNYKATTEIVRELSGLPTTCESLILRLRGGAPPADWPMSRALVLIPRSYSVVMTEASALWPAELEAFVFGAPTDRTAEQPLEVQVWGKDKAWGEEMMRRMQLSDTYPHVTVVGR